MPRIVFTPSGLTGDVDTGTTVLTAARQLGVDLDSVCGGRGICGRCQVEPSTGSFAKWAIDSAATALSDWSSVEVDYETKGNVRRPLREGRRLGCAATVLADAVIAVPSESQVHKQVVRKSVDLTGLVIDPQFTLLNVDVPKAVLGDSESVTELIGEAVERIHGVTVRTWSTTVLRAAHKAATNEHGSVTIAVDRDGVAVAIWPGFVDTALGVAIDVGSTTVAGHLCDLSTGEVLATAGMMNPQIRFGEDLMSRVSYVMMNPGGDKELTACIRAALNELITDLLRLADSPADELLDIVIVGNPIMHHIVLGIDPTPLGQAPFTLASAEAIRTTALDLGLQFPTARAFVGPCIAGHVGADTTAAMLAEGPHRGEQLAVAGRRRHQRGDRAGLRRAAVRRVEPHRPGVRGRPDLMRPARHCRRHRAGSHRSFDTRAALQGDRVRSVERRTRLRCCDRGSHDQRRVRIGDHRGDR